MIKQLIWFILSMPIQSVWAIQYMHMTNMGDDIKCEQYSQIL